VTIQYARLFQLRAGIELIAELGPLTKGDLAEELRQRKSFDFDDMEVDEGAKDIIEHLQQVHLTTETEDGYRLTSTNELASMVENTALLYAGETIPGAGSESSQADRILANTMYEFPMLIPLSKYVYRHAPVTKNNIKREYDGQEFLGDKMNPFTIDMGVDLLTDAEAITRDEPGYGRGRWPIRLFAHVAVEEFRDMAGGSGSVGEPALFGRLETMYAIDRPSFDRLLARLTESGIVSEGSYEELLLNTDRLSGTRIHE
jgi:hypothetical protein